MYNVIHIYLHSCIGTKALILFRFSNTYIYMYVCMCKRKTFIHLHLLSEKHLLINVYFIESLYYYVSIKICHMYILDMNKLIKDARCVH